MVEDRVIVYGHAACPMVPPVRGLLSKTGVPYEYVNIHQDAAARQRVREINNGYESVPTLVLPDGSTLTEPTIGQLQARLGALGYHVPLSARLIGYLPQIIIGAVIFYSLLDLLGVV